MSTLEIISQNKCFGGTQTIYRHQSHMTQCPMRFGVFIPPPKDQAIFPVLYWLSGLTCTEENFITKACAQRIAAELGIILVVPDASPRGLGIPGDDTDYAFGCGASYYVDATLTPWSHNYRMYSYLSVELPELIAAQFPVDENRVGIFGHSMGGHGALMLALKNPNYYKSVSAFAPICSIAQSPWGKNALQKFLGDDVSRWEDYDVVALIERLGWRGPPILIDQGTDDKFLEQQLKPELLRQACLKAKVELNLHLREGYDHSYFFIMSFMEEHLRYHAKNV